jgi:hypothetical protein
MKTENWTSKHPLKAEVMLRFSSHCPKPRWTDKCGPAPEAVSVHQNLQELKIDGYVFWDQNLCIVFDAHSAISLTGIDQIKHLSIIRIHIIFLMFIIQQTGHGSK